MNEVASVRLDGVSKTYPGTPRPAVDGVDLAIEAGSFFSILGPSGCGKTTLLRIIAGFEFPDAGRVKIGDRDVTGLSPRNRDIAMVFQDYALYPHMTAEKNITFNLRNRRVPRAEIAERLRDTSGLLGIDDILKKRPAQLSGGERQRVALGRAMIRRPKVFLMDEPLSNLDLKLREAMRIELGRLHQELGITIVYVTHDQTEAMTLSTELAVLRDGIIQQVGKPDAVYAQPANIFIARFIGSPSMNLFRMVARGGTLRPVTSEHGRLSLPRDVPIDDGEEYLVGIRPHDMVAHSAKNDGLPVDVIRTEHLGRSNFVDCGPVEGPQYLYEQSVIQIETDATAQYEPGARLILSAPPETIRLFDGSGNRLRP